MPPLPKLAVDGGVVAFLVRNVVDDDGRRAAWQADHAERTGAAEREVDRVATELTAARARADFGRPRFAAGEMTGAQLRQLRAEVEAAEGRRDAVAASLAALRAERVPDELAHRVAGALDVLRGVLEMGVDTALGQALAHRSLRGTYERFTVYLEDPGAHADASHDAVWDPDAPPISADQVARLLDPHPSGPPPRTAPRRASDPGRTGDAGGGAQLAVHLLPDLRADLTDTVVLSIALHLPATAA